MKYRNLSPDEATGGSGATEATVTPNFGMLSDEMFEPTYNAAEVKAEKEVEQKVEQDNKEQTPSDLSLEKQEEQKGEEKPSEETEQKVEKSEESESAEEDKADDFELKLDESNIDGKQETKIWQETAKDLFGVEVQEDSYEAFVDAAKIAIQEAEERGKASTIDSELAKLPVEAQVDFLLLQAGYSREQINEPTKEIDSALGMSDIDLVKYDLELKGYTQEMVEREIEHLTEKGLIDHEAEKHRLFLKQARESVLKERADLANQVATNYQAKLEAEKQAEYQTMSKAFDTVKDFMGQAINENTRKEIAKRYTEGKYDAILNDPIKKAEFLMYHHFGEQVVKNIRNKALEEGREKVTKHLSNIPPVVSKNNAVGNAQRQTNVSGFEALSTIFKD